MVNKSEVTRTPTFNFGDCYTSQLILHSLLLITPTCKATFASKL